MGKQTPLNRETLVSSTSSVPSLLQPWAANTSSEQDSGKGRCSSGSLGASQGGHMDSISWALGSSWKGLLWNDGISTVLERFS